MKNYIKVKPRASQKIILIYTPRQPAPATHITHHGATAAGQYQYIFSFLFKFRGEIEIALAKPIDF